MKALRQRAAYLAVLAGVTMLSGLPEPVIRRLGRLAGRIWYLVDPPRRRMARRHMRRLGVDPRAAREVFASYGRYWTESLWVRPRHFEGIRSRMSVDGLEHLQKAHGEGNGVIVVLAHVGNWEAAALIAIDLQMPLVAVAESLANRHITEWFTRQRQMFNIEIVLTGEGRVRKRLVAALEEGKALALLADRDLSGRGVKVDFFGETTTLPAGPVLLARQSGAPILPVGVYFKPDGGHHAIIHPRLQTGPDDDPAVVTQEVARHLEEIVLHDPSQWHMVQPNWPSDRA